MACPDELVTPWSLAKDPDPCRSAPQAREELPGVTHPAEMEVVGYSLGREPQEEDEYAGALFPLSAQ